MHVVYARQAHFLHQPILQSLIGTLHTSLGLRSVGRNAFNAQLTRGTSKLGFSFCFGVLGIDVEDAVPIAVVSTPNRNVRFSAK